MSECAIEIAGVELANPLIAAAGTVGYGPELAEVFDVAGLGAITTKSITPEVREGNDPWRVVDLPAGMLNAVGLANLGLDRFLEEVVPQLAALPTVAIGSIAGHTLEDYSRVAEAFDAIDALPLVEVNVSCPNTDTGRQFGDEVEPLVALVKTCREALRHTPMIVKLSLGSGRLPELARAAVDAGADALCIGNTVPAMAVDPETHRSRLGRASGGMSGPAVHPMAVHRVHALHTMFDSMERFVPIIGLGGVTSWEDAAEFILVGATAVGMGTILMADPSAPRRILKGLRRWVARHGGELPSLRGAYQG
ncbi:MAG: dihydroorotate dehydrogenase [Phycisphaerales bacterium]|nr:dihydroorotate dehydrogenase [Phycisphaerales bacterium]